MNQNFLQIFKNLNITTLAKNTSNTLNVVKKIIPVYKEIRPFVTKEKKIVPTKEIKKENDEELKYNNSITFFH